MFVFNQMRIPSFVPFCPQNDPLSSVSKTYADRGSILSSSYPLNFQHLIISSILSSSTLNFQRLPRPLRRPLPDPASHPLHLQAGILHSQPDDVKDLPNHRVLLVQVG